MPFSASASARRVLAAVVCVTLAGVAGLVSPRPAAAAEDLAALLARPVSPGAIALLAQHATQPDAQKRLAEAVKHENPAVRAVAARVAFITMSKGLAPALIGAVAKEDQPHTAAEQIRALMGLLGPPGDNIVLAAVKRIGGPATIAMAESLARTRPMDIAKKLPEISALAAGYENELAVALATACVQHSSFADEILLAVMASKDDDLLAKVFQAVHDIGHPVPTAVLLQALKSSEEHQRVIAVWHVLTVHDDGDLIPSEVLSAAAPHAIAADAAAASLTWEGFARELFARQRGRAATRADWAGLVSSVEKTRAMSLPADAYGLLTDAELKAIHTVRGDNYARDIRRHARQREWDTQKSPEARTQTMRTVPVFAKGLLADLMTLNGCRPPRDTQFAAGDVKYQADGRPQSISVMQAQLSQECQSFVRSLIVLTIASPGHPVSPERVDRVMVLFDRAFLACADDPFARVDPRAADQAFEHPKPKREPKVLYPEAFRKSGMPDMVVELRIRVSPTGCVSSAETLRSVLPAFDLAAIQSLFASTWTPATRGGQPVDSQVIYAVLFTLRR